MAVRMQLCLCAAFAACWLKQLQGREHRYHFAGDYTEMLLWGDKCYIGLSLDIDLKICNMLVRPCSLMEIRLSVVVASS